LLWLSSQWFYLHSFGLPYNCSIPLPMKIKQSC
jgi:hypothetical protein